MHVAHPIGGRRPSSDLQAEVRRAVIWGSEDSDDGELATIVAYLHDGLVDPSSHLRRRAVVSEKTWGVGSLLHTTADKTWLF